MKARTKLVAWGVVSLALLGTSLLTMRPPKKSIFPARQHSFAHAPAEPSRVAVEPSRTNTSVAPPSLDGQRQLSAALAPKPLDPTMTAYQRSFIEPALEVLEQFRQHSELTGNATVAAAIELERANLARAAAGLPKNALPAER